MHEAAGEKDWDPNAAMHSITGVSATCFALGVMAHDCARRLDPTNMKPHRNWSASFGGTHSCLPLLDRELLIVADEPNA